MLQHIKEQISAPGAKPGTLIHIGAGTGTELQDYLDLKFSRIVLYEAVPELAEELREKSRGYQQVSVEQVVVAGKKEKVTFHQMNNPRFSSLSEQKNLKQYYPNLHSTPIQMEAESLAEIIDMNDLTNDAINVLVLEVLGSEQVLISSVDAEALQQFNWILVNSVGAGRETIANQTTAEQLLLHADFTLEQHDDEGYPFSRETFRRDDNAIAFKVLKQRKEIITEELEQEKTRSERLDKELEKKGNELEEAKAFVKDLQSQISEKKQLQNKLDSKDKEIKEANDLVKELQKNFDKNESTLQLNTKMLAKAQQDLEDLREKYAAKVNSENELQRLIAELYEKLKMASNFYSKLQAKHPELLDKEMD